MEFSFETTTISEPDELDELPGVDESNFRLQLTKGKLILTYKTHIPKAEFAKWLRAKGKACDVWVAHETADKKNPYLHSHVLIIYHEKMETKSCKYFDFMDIHPHIKKIITQTHYCNVLKYMCKEDKSIEDDMVLLAQQAKITIFDQVSECATIQDALRLANTAGEALGIVTMFNLRGMRPIRVLAPKYQWQIDLDEELRTNPHDRKIIWYYDAKGKSGKTKFLKYQIVTYPQDIYAVSQFGGATNAATIVKNAVDGGWNGQGFIVNLVRSAETKSIYEPLEMIKDGFITATKYNGGSIVFPEPHVIVFANFLPDVHSMSLDRWEVRVIEHVNDVPRVVEVLDGWRLAEMMKEEEELDPHGAVGPMMDKLYDDGQRDARLAARSYL